jgi:hypothetical protein
MTPNITVIGEKQPSKNKKPIELLYLLVLGDNAEDSIMVDSEDGYSTNYQNIELICRNYRMGFDLIFCYDKDRDNPDYSSFFVGRWNDGVV